MAATQIAPALTEAYRNILPINATYKHIVLLTDGILGRRRQHELLRKRSCGGSPFDCRPGCGCESKLSQRWATTAGGKSYS